MNIWLCSVIFIILGTTLLEITASILNLKAFSPNLPLEFTDVIDHEKYEKSQQYSKATAIIGITENAITSLATLGCLLFRGFNYIDTLCRSFGYGELISGLLYIGAFAGIMFCMSLPFSLYSTFIIEERFGFNNTSLRTFILDKIKGAFLTLLIGTPLLAAILWFFQTAGPLSWLYCWLFVTVVTIFIQFIAPSFILPLFNKFMTLPEGTLRNKIENYAAQQHFSLNGIYTMDGSKRSSKLNAFFTGFGKYRRIVLFDTLVEKLSEDQIIAVLAHEMGHFKLKHILKMFIVSFINTGLFFFLLGKFLTGLELSFALGVALPSIHSGLIFFGIIFSPLSLLIALFINQLSRKHEYQADHFASVGLGSSHHLIDALKILSRENLSNLTPHPLNVALHYSHPPILERIKALRLIHSL